MLAAAWASVVLALLGALVGATWRVGSALGSIKEAVKRQNGRLDKMEDREDAHDRWHLDRLTDGLDEKRRGSPRGV